jgi:nucleoside-diphosphate-sugar epimerase
MTCFITGGSGFIGTHLVDFLESRSSRLVNFSLDPPFKESHQRFWRRGDILDAGQLQAALQEAQPDVVIHLAARTDCDENTSIEAGYSVNTEGTRNLVKAVKAMPSVKRLIVVSSQFVCRPGHLPKNDTDFNPETVYGASKAQSEVITRELDPSCTWTIVRPTNIWGPWHRRYAQEFWKVCENGWYLHPAVPSPVRSYGYVGNVVWQIGQLLSQPASEIHRKVFYLGDAPAPIDQWISGFHWALSGRQRMRAIPYSVLRVLAKAGDGISWVTGKPFLITSSRLKSMTTNYPTPMEPTFALLGAAPYSLQQGIDETVEWLKSTGYRPT